jgi:tetratricopeptide (TPR) repeat protein
MAAPCDKPDAALRVFLSYGHDEHAELADRLKRDLQGRGHVVWFDQERLTSGEDWEHRIEQGLDWVAEHPAAGRIVLLMTPHSVRRPDGYCLNEVARAVERRLKVVPVMVVWCEPPLSICRIQWLDMRDCVPLREHPGRYEARFARLAEALEGGRLDFEGVQARLLQVLQPLPFDADIEQHVVRFSGRQWVLDQVDRWLADRRAPRIFWIVGEPGVGKTAIASWLCARRREVAAFHLCRHRHKQKADPCRCVLSIAYQLSTQLGDYQDRLAGLDLEELTADADAGSLFDRLIAQPLSQDFPRPDRLVVLLIDALDEASEGGRNELASFLASEFDKTPDWLRLVITSRPDLEVTHPLQGLEPFVLDKAAPQNGRDIRLFLERELRPFAASTPQLARAVDAILERSGGLFLYAEWIRKEVAAGQLSLERPDEFPRGLGMVYARYFDRQFPDPAAFARDVQPVLEAVLAARQPLDADTLQRLFGWNDYQRMRFRLAVGSLFPEADGRVQPFHKSIALWLTDPARAGPYFVSLHEGNRRLADLGWREFEADPAALSPYARSCLPAHLDELLRWDDLARLLGSEAYAASRLAPDVETLHDLVQDYARAVAHLPEAARQALWRGSAKCALLALRGVGVHVDRGDPDLGLAILERSGPAILARPEPDLRCLWHRLAGRAALKAGHPAQAEQHFSECLTIARQAHYGEGIAKALLNIASVLEKAEAGGPDPTAVLEEALAADFSAVSPEFRATALLSLARVHIRRGRADRALACLAQARDPIARAHDPLLPAWLRKYEGCARLLAGEAPAATTLLSEAAAAFARAGRTDDASRCLLMILDATCDRFERSKPTAAPSPGTPSIGAPYARAHAEARSRIAAKPLDVAAAVASIEQAAVFGEQWAEEESDRLRRELRETVEAAGKLIGPAEKRDPGVRELRIKEALKGLMRRGRRARREGDVPTLRDAAERAQAIKDLLRDFLEKQKPLPRRTDLSALVAQELAALDADAGRWPTAAGAFEDLRTALAALDLDAADAPLDLAILRRKRAAVLRQAEVAESLRPLDADHGSGLLDLVRTTDDLDSLSLDSVGSGSGLLDLTRESDDTSLGRLILPEETGPDALEPTEEAADLSDSDILDLPDLEEPK